MKFKKSKSPRKKLREEIGKVMLEILKKKRGEKCEICGKVGVVLGKFHILSVGSHPRLEFVEKNILLSDWFPCHFFWHHGGRTDKRNEKTMERIVELRGADWEHKLLEEERWIGKHDEQYLLLKLYQLKKELALYSHPLSGLERMR